MLALKGMLLTSFCVSFAVATSGDIFDAAYLCHVDDEKEYCPTDGTCKPNGDCSECGGNYDVDNKYHICVSNTPRICQRQSKKYCPSDNSCVTACSSCAYFDGVDSNKHTCMQPSPITCGALRVGVTDRTSTFIARIQKLAYKTRTVHRAVATINTRTEQITVVFM